MKQFLHFCGNWVNDLLVRKLFTKNGIVPSELKRFIGFKIICMLDKILRIPSHYCEIPETLEET